MVREQVQTEQETYVGCYNSAIGTRIEGYYSQRLVYFTTASSASD